MPELDRASREYAAQGEPVSFLAVDYKETAGALRKYLREVDLSIPMPLDRDGKVAERYLVRGFPTAFVIDKKGIIRDKVVGALDFGAVKARIEPLLAE